MATQDSCPCRRVDGVDRFACAFSEWWGIPRFGDGVLSAVEIRTSYDRKRLNSLVPPTLVSSLIVQDGAEWCFRDLIQFRR
ncbi:hypothetical protein [Thalassoglobus neptunius]|uniref:hypothetical protein n=1 Tax=Thalassoglobus neptunius TaxID=1938619 RepID=UPI0011B6F2C7|nr:hypothetical protein [Thalassoglobus neptunius]